MSTPQKFIVFAIVVATASGLHAQGRATLVRPRLNVSFIESWRPANVKDGTRIVGQVLDSRQMPVPDVSVRLRDLLSGLVVQRTATDADGQYQFSLDEPGTYIVEMVMADGNVMALSKAGALARFETMQTTVQLPGRWEGMSRRLVMPQQVTSFVGLSAATTMTAQTVAIALAQRIQPVDSGEPVSPFKP